MKFIRNIAAMLTDPEPSPQEEKPETPKAEPKPEKTLEDQMREKWAVGKTVVATMDIFGSYMEAAERKHKAGDKGEVIRLEWSKVETFCEEEHQHLFAHTTFGLQLLLKRERRQKSGLNWTPWSVQTCGQYDCAWNPSKFCLEEEAYLYQDKIERWNNPKLSFKIRKKEGTSRFSVWFQHRAHAEGYTIVKQTTGKNEPCQFDSIEDARSAIEILKIRLNPRLIEYFSRQYEDVEGEFYTVETVS